MLKSGKINCTIAPYGKRFEKNISEFIGNNYSVACFNGTVALEVAIKSLNLPEKNQKLLFLQEVFASASCIINTGHIPVFADVYYFTQNIF